MKHLRMSAVVAVLVILTAGMTTGAGEDWETLKSHKTVSVKVEDIDTDAIALGLTKKHVQTIVEQRLRQAGLRVLGDARAFLHVNITTNIIPDVYWTANVSAYFVQGVALMNPPSLTTHLAVTWLDGSLVSGGMISFPSGVERALNKVMNKFINDWLRANPKE